ncbi:MAG TPA: ABC transporter permease [Bacteroidia bacterium]|nr:ABC transporter permease [Bacteroidia bacterium]
MLVFRLLKESILFALNALVSNKLRTFLSLLGITIGIFAIISVFTVVDSLENSLRTSVASLGDDVVYVQKWPWTFGPDYPWWKYMDRPQPTTEELSEIQRRCQNAAAMAYEATFSKTVQYHDNSMDNVSLAAISDNFNDVKKLEINDGRYFSEAEFASGKNIALIGDAIVQGLFSGENPIGKEIEVMGRKLTIVGTLKKQGESMIGETVDNNVFVPVNFARNIVDMRKDQSNPTILVKAKTGITNAQLIDELTGIMRSIRKLQPLADDDFALNQTSMLSKQFDGLFGIVGIIGWIIGGFAILVGGFGIANIMFVSVKERTNIIGIQKSLGAKNYFILLQFLTESVVLSFIGGLLGLVIIYIAILFIGDSFGMTLVLSSSNIILGLTISILIGVISGFIPAYGASQLDPVEAIRSN